MSTELDKSKPASVLELMHPSHCDCEICMIENEETHESHDEDCRCFHCEQKLAAAINRSPSTIGFTDEYLLRAWRNGEPIRPGLNGMKRPKDDDRYANWHWPL